jgi:DUF2917 family protein
MACYETRTVVDLANHEAVTLPNVRGATIRVARGILWLTEERQRNDVVLRAGDDFLVEFDGKTVVEARDSARFTIVGRSGKELKLPRCGATVSRFAAGLASWLSPPRQAPYV